MSEYTIRYATEADFDDVMAFGDVYWGIDYLKSSFHNFIRDPSARSYVYVLRGEIVGFCCAFLVDDDMTLVIRAARVKVGHRGQGIYGKLARHIHREYRKISSVKFEAFVSSSPNFESNKQGILKEFVLISWRAFSSYRFQANKTQLPELPEEANTTEMTPEDVTSLMSDTSLHKELFPGGRIMIDYVPLRLMKSNIKYILTPMTSSVLQTSSPHRLVSFGARRECQLGFLYQVDVFGSDVTSLRHHLLFHIHRLRTLTEGDAVFLIACEPICKEAANKIVKAFGISTFEFKIKSFIQLERRF